MDQIDLSKPFKSVAGLEEMMNDLLPALHNANLSVVAFFALEGLIRVDKDCNGRGNARGEASESVIETIRTFLRKWRCESPLDASYTFRPAVVSKFHRSLTIFKNLEVPLFIDSYGEKRLMSEYDHRVNIHFNLDTTIVHMTHTTAKDKIVEDKRLKPSDNKNIIAGTWFVPNQPQSSVYGNWAFETTLRKLGVRGIRQGEIVSYKQEVNFILYASDTENLAPVQIATENAVKRSQRHSEAYTAVSIFVPAKFLPQSDEEFDAAFGQPNEVPHGPFCVKVKRNVMMHCPYVQAW